MKVRGRDVFWVLLDLIILRPLANLLRKASKIVLLRGRNGYVVLGSSYWGVYQTISKIVHRVSRIKSENDHISIEIPVTLSNGKYFHFVLLYGVDKEGGVHIEYNYSSDQCGIYTKRVHYSKLHEELELLGKEQEDVKAIGYIYEEF